MELNRVALVLYGLALAFFAGLEVWVLVLESRHLDIDPLMIRDFSNYWAGAKILFEGDPVSVFDQQRYFPQLQAIYGADYTWHNWSYPPHFLLFCAPLYFMNYHLALAVFLLSTLVFFLFAADRYARIHASAWTGGRSPFARPVFVLLLAAAVFCNIRYAQNGFLTSGLLLMALAYWHKRPVMAGIFLGLLTIKPQLGILIPLLLLFDGNWRAILSAVATTLFLVLVSILVLGTQAWIDYVTITMPYQSTIMTVLGDGQPYLAMMMSAFSGMRTLGINGSPACSVHLLFAIPALVFGYLAIRARRDALHRFAILVMVTFLVSPYSFIYDAGVLTVVCASLGIFYRDRFAASPEASLADELRFRFLYLAATLPVVSGLVTMLVFPVSPLVLLFCVFLLTPAAERLLSGMAGRQESLMAKPGHRQA